MTRLSHSARRHLEIAFDSSCAIVKLAGLQSSKDLASLRNQIIEGELTFDEAVQIVSKECAISLSTKK